MRGTRVLRPAYSLLSMEMSYTAGWVDAQVAQTIPQWDRCALPSLPASVRYTPKEQRTHEKAYDQGLRAVRREARRAPRTRSERLASQQRIVQLFPGFASVALGLNDEQNDLITGRFLPVATELARWTRAFDPTLSTAGIIQACRNAWSCCGLQAMLGQPMELTPSVLAYSLLYPYTDNYLDQPELSAANKLEFSERFYRRLSGHRLAARNPHEACVWTMVQLIEDQYPRAQYPQVFDSLLAIHRAQQDSMAQMNRINCIRKPDNLPDNLPDSLMDNSTAAILDSFEADFQYKSLDNMELLRITCAKGGTSVLADACLVQPWLTTEEARFAFEWGVLLQLGDDLQDVREDLRRGSITLFTRAIAQGRRLDAPIAQLLHFSAQIADRMEQMPHGSASLKGLLRMSWRSLILMAVADVQPWCSPVFLDALEPCSSFRFNFLRERNQNIDSRAAFHHVLFDAFIEAGAGAIGTLPMPEKPASLLQTESTIPTSALASSFA